MFKRGDRRHPIWKRSSFFTRGAQAWFQRLRLWSVGCRHAKFQRFSFLDNVSDLLMQYLKWRLMIWETFSLRGHRRITYHMFENILVIGNKLVNYIWPLRHSSCVCFPLNESCLGILISIQSSSDKLVMIYDIARLLTLSNFTVFITNMHYLLFFIRSRETLEKTS